ncbi:ribonuclease D [Oryzomonas rubra]|uniref:Ribonuclease D n=1 Tax=Oryzomonas rubra TaxID=2509454 RepID=A0A5A9XDK8_9BACT|nr:HRDC domain-containing protein [Oryzomonas rubra]KAA0889721.1 ribonuclease D [Oryzomonas rubra]
MTHLTRQAGTCEIVTTAARLKELAEHLCRHHELAVDLEMDSLHHYREKVCLIQVSTRSESWLIDPLALEDLSPLAAPLGNPAILIVMHGSDYDIRSLHRDFGIEVKNLFDTMLAARFLGVAEFGLAALLRARFGIELDKKYQKADWSKRPLSPEMCAYASADTSDLLPLYDQLHGELAGKGRLAWQEEECALVCQARVSEKEGPLFLSCKGAGKLKGRSLAALEELLRYRDRQAQQVDRPPFKVMSAETLLEAAEKKPRSLSELAGIKGMTPKQLNRHGSALLAAVTTALELPEERLPRFPRTRREDPSEGAKERLKRLKSWREKSSAALGLEPGVIAPNWLLEAAADMNPPTRAGLDGIAGMREWQKGLYGTELIEVLEADGQ